MFGTCCLIPWYCRMSGVEGSDDMCGTTYYGARHREARGDAGDSAKLPATGYRPPMAGETIERKVHRIAGDKILRDIEGRESAGAGEVERIAGIGDARCLIDRLAPGVVEREVIALARVTKTGLQGIVV